MPPLILLLALLVLLPQATTDDEIPSPREWIAFSAEVRGSGRMGPFEGRFYRGADGSTRKETGPTGGSVDTIVIKNLRRGEEYTCRRTCVSRPLVNAMTTPPRMRKSLPGLLKLETPIEGFEAYRWQSGVLSTVIPALNFFAVEMNSAAVTEAYSKIRVGQQAAELFERPSQ